MLRQCLLTAMMMSSICLSHRADAQDVENQTFKSKDKSTEIPRIKAHSREKDYTWDTIVLRNPYKDTAAYVTNFVVTVIEETPTYGNVVTKIIINFDINNVTENDQEPNNTARFDLTLLDKGEKILLPHVVGEPFMRSHCTYGGPEHFHYGPIQISENAYDIIGGGSLDIYGPSGKEGPC